MNIYLANSINKKILVCFVIFFFQIKESTSGNPKPTPTVETIQLKSDFETSKGEGDDFLLNFEKFASEQRVAFFSHKMDTSK